MLSHRKKCRKYLSPRVLAAQIDPQAPLCFSAVMQVEVDELKNINAQSDNQEPLYFEF